MRLPVSGKKRILRVSLPVACICGHEWPDLRGFEGQLVNCPQCSNTVRVPGKPRPPAAPPAQAAPVPVSLSNGSAEPTPLQRFGAASAQQPVSTRILAPARPTWQGTAPLDKPQAEVQPLEPGLKTLLRRAGTVLLVARCAEAYEVQAEYLLRQLALQQEEGAVLEPGYRLPLGWATLGLRAKGEERIVCAPDFSRNPFDDLQDDLTVALRVFVNQQETARRASLKKPMPVLYTDEVVLAQGCLTHRLIVMERRDFPSRGFTGWHILPGDPADLRRVEEKKKWERTPSYRILGRREVLLDLLNLPVGFSARIEDDNVISVLNAHKEQVWSA